MDQSKKLYFKQSATEALHSAILLKARNPSGMSGSGGGVNDLSPAAQQGTTTTTMPLLSQASDSSAASQAKNQSPKLTLCPKLANANTLLTISASMANSSQILNNLNSTLDLMNNSCSGGGGIGNTSGENGHQLGENLDELDSPFKIKENILASIRNLKPVLIGLDPLRSSTSDDEDSHADNVERKFKHCYKKSSDATQMDHSSYENENNGNCSSNNSNEDHSVVLIGSSNSQTSNAKSPFSLPSAQANYYNQGNQKHVYLRANSTNSKNLTKLPNCTNASNSNTIINIFSRFVLFWEKSSYHF